MTQLAESFISTFDRLPLIDPPVSDEELVQVAEDMFLDLDRREAMIV